MEVVMDFLFLDSKITADGDCSHEIKRHLLIGRKTVKSLDSVLKSRDITLPTEVRVVKAMIFPVVMYGWRRKWQPTPVFLPRESHEQRSLVGCCPWGRRVGHDRSDLACMHTLEKEMVTQCSILAWRIP